MSGLVTDAAIDAAMGAVYWDDDPDLRTCTEAMLEAAAPLIDRYDRELLVTVIIHHGRTNIKGCHCGWARLGESHAEHVADVYEAAMAARLGGDSGE